MIQICPKFLVVFILCKIVNLRVEEFSFLNFFRVVWYSCLRFRSNGFLCFLLDSKFSFFLRDEQSVADHFLKITKTKNRGLVKCSSVKTSGAKALKNFIGRIFSVSRTFVMIL